ncbi:16S rRNA (adenine(1518)-N(6)/adenine(1519)-N(6))-dimethyltransferase RsmA [Phormidium sp. CLA17]|uniref:16S rRNA (adenine(1518)-N(6)/adenine(1519)-N(6))- dimethyltransferase RsmA n=1 Tax=Leptolyngbya sp. Cla-17 TaxID=2803751 RepID=UPI001492297F|nr:16S rRNA (adenine(1518)-N(6)/adenine(1519)-N(6))-dimethyltransferase RsmA [Leptolyngbya sp. Cla-17]MBM0742124.1 16S rRNA (adenine(1518)-N(6)/adenine(1519)-N(6))-dimethyltransferase RsmA [Leptolyngbya sp. Cla-17]
MPQPRKQFGQHWLQSEKALSSIVAAAELKKTSPDTVGDRVLEIGPGTGVLTRQLLPQADSVVAVEIDRDLCELLIRKLGKIDNFLLLQEDFLTVDLPAMLAPLPEFQNPNKVVANIPYNITGPIIEKLLGTIACPAENPFESIVLLVQKEVALRLNAKPGSTNFGALTVRVQYLADCDFICDVSAKAFQPVPKVDSAVIRLRPRSFQPAANDLRFFETLLKLGFGSKRKMLRNNLQSLIDRDRLSQLLEILGANPQSRAEDLSVEQWVLLSNQLVVDS